MSDTSSSYVFREIEFTLAVLCKIGFDRMIDGTFTKKYGRAPDISYSFNGLRFIANLICQQHPLYNIQDMFIKGVRFGRYKETP